MGWEAQGERPLPARATSATQVVGAAVHEYNATYMADGPYGTGTYIEGKSGGGGGSAGTAAHGNNGGRNAGGAAVTGGGAGGYGYDGYSNPSGSSWPNGR